MREESNAALQKKNIHTDSFFFKWKDLDSTPHVTNEATAPIHGFVRL